MHDNNQPVVDERLAENLDGPAKLSALIRAKHQTLAGFARAIGVWPEQVKACLAGARPADEIREAISLEFALPRAEVDHLIDSARSTPSEAA